MSIFLDPVPLAVECAAGVGLIVAVASRVGRRIRSAVRIEPLVFPQSPRPAELPRPAEFRRYTLLGTAAGGDPLLHDSTRSAGTIITMEINGRREQFELTDVPLRDGTYAAEKLDRYV